MKKTKKRIMIYSLPLLLSLGLVACNPTSNSSSTPDLKDYTLEDVYNLAVKAGYTGTFEDWIATLKGDKGDTGATGATGSKGDKGDTGEKGDKGDTGEKGDKGDTGEKGDKGETGSKGDKGDTGATGKDGKSLRTGAGTPLKSTGNDGDSYVDTLTWDFYTKANGEWTKTGNLKGETGATGDKGDKGDTGDKGDKGDTGDKGETGTSLHTGMEKPSSSLGNDGDSYICVSDWSFYMKAEGKWVRVGTIKGEDGTDASDSHLEYRVVDDGDVIALKRFWFGTDDAIGAALKTVAKPAEVTVNANPGDKGFSKDSYDVYPFTQNGSTYTSSNKEIGSSQSVMTATATKAGSFSFSYKVQGEARYDYLIVYKNDTAVSDKLSNGATEMEGTMTVDLALGDVVTFVYRKDGSGNRGEDRAEITINDSSYTTGMVTYNSLGGTRYLPSITVNGTLTEALPTPTKDGFYFAGWYTSENFTEDEKVTDEYTFAKENTTLYAYWIPNSEANVLMGSHYGLFYSDTASSASNSYSKLDVDFFGNYSSQSGYSTFTSGQFTDYDETAGTFNVGNKKAYYDASTGLLVLKEQGTDENSIYFIGSTEKIATSVSKTCYFESGKYRFVEIAKDGAAHKIFINGKTGEVFFDVETYDLDGNVVETTNITSSFVVIVKDKNGNDVAKFGTTYSALKEANELMGVYTVEGTTDTVKVSGAGCLIYSKLGETRKISYDTLNESTLNITSTNSYNYDITLDTTSHTATIVENKYTISYEWNNHEVVDAANPTFVWQKSWLDVPAPEVNTFVDEEGIKYVFKGWFTNEELTESYRRHQLTGDITLYAKWVDGATITYDANGGTSKKDSEVVGIGDTLSLPQVSKSGFIFDGWYNGEVLFDGETEVTGDVKLVAKWVEAPYYIKTFYGANLDDSNFGSKSRKSTSSYRMTLTEEKKIEGNKFSGRTFDLSSYDETTHILTLNNTSSTPIFFYQCANGMVIAVSPYSESGTLCSDDFSMYAASDTNSNVSFDTIYWDNGFMKITKVTVGDKVAYVLTNGRTNTVVADVHFTNFAGEAIEFASLYNTTDKKFADEVIILDANNSVVAKYGGSESGFVNDDGAKGTYTGSLNGVNANVVLNGFGKANVSFNGAASVEGTYKVEDDVITLEANGVTYKFTHVDGTLTQVLDGYEGTYTNGENTLTLTGWGDATFNGASTTYTLNGDMIIFMNGSEEVYCYVNRSTQTYEIATMSKFSGLTFTGTHKDVWNDDEPISFAFDNGVLITGTVKFGYSSSYSTTFSGTLTGDTLVITITKELYGNGLLNKTATFKVEDGKLTCTDTQLGSGTYKIQKGTVVTNSSFVA